MPTSAVYPGAGVAADTAIATAIATAMADDKIVNGTFAADTNWTKGTGFTISAGAAHGAAGAASDLSAAVAPLTSGVTYLVTYTILNWTAGTLVAKCGTQVGTVRGGPGTFTEKVTANGTGFLFSKDAAFAGDIDNVSCKDINAIIPAAAGPWQIDGPATPPELAVNGGFGADTDWTKGTGWTIAAGVAHGVAGSASDLSAAVPPLISGHDYSITYTVSAYVSGTITAKAGTQGGTARSANNPYTETIRANGTGLVFSKDAAFLGSIDNVSVIDLTARYAITLQTYLDLQIDGDLLGKAGNFLGIRDCMIGADKKSNFRLHGTGTVRMGGVAQFGTYANPVAPYTPEEHRHCLSIRGCSFFVVDGALNFNGSGGDGIYVGQTDPDLDSLWTPSTDYLISGATCNANLRQGCSVLSSRRGTVYHCTFTNTLGVSPQSGIDLEPERDNINNIEGELTDVRIIECVAYGNASRDFFMNLTRLGAATPTFSVLYQNCISGKPDGSVTDGDGFDFVMATGGPSAGAIDVVGCRAQNLNYRALRLAVRVDQGPSFRFKDFWAKDVARLTAEKPIIVDLGAATSGSTRINFDRLRVSDRYDRAVIAKTSAPTVCRELAGKILVDRVRTFLPAAKQTAGFPCLFFEKYRETAKKQARRLTRTV